MTAGQKQTILIMSMYYMCSAAAAVITFLLSGSVHWTGIVGGILAAAGLPLKDWLNAIVNLLKPDLPPDEKPAAPAT